jgi:hypothetical protein
VVGVPGCILDVPQARASRVLDLGQAGVSMQAECLLYSPTALAAFSRNSEPSRM